MYKLRGFEAVGTGVWIPGSVMNSKGYLGSIAAGWPGLRHPVAAGVWKGVKAAAGYAGGVFLWSLCEA